MIYPRLQLVLPSLYRSILRVLREPCIWHTLRHLLFFFFFFKIDWLNKYHKDCREKVGKMLKDQGKQDVYDWLVEITKPVEQKGGTPTAGSVTLTLSAITWMSVAAISMFLFVWETTAEL